MKHILAAAALAALMTAGSVANAAIVVFQANAAPVAANKVSNADISIGDFVVATEILAPGDTAEFVFTALEKLRVSTISLSGSGVGKTNLGFVRFGFTDALGQSFMTDGSVAVTNGSAAATAFLPGGVLNKDDVLTIFWGGPLTSPAGVTASFVTTAVPIPAALPLLLGGIAALGVASRRKRS